MHTATAQASPNIAFGCGISLSAYSDKEIRDLPGFLYPKMHVHFWQSQLPTD
jgi:hypothetical protein